jgi:hypothetical protein
VNCTEVAQRFFSALAEERWDDAVAYFADSFKREHAKHIRHRFAVMIYRFDSDRGVAELPNDLDALIGLWLAKSDYRAAAERALAEARRDQPECEWEVVGGVESPRRWVVGEIRESPDRCIVAYRSWRPDGPLSTLQLVLEDGEWRICSEEFAFEGDPGLAPKRKSEGRDI